MQNGKTAPEWMSQEQKELWEKSFGVNARRPKKKQSPANALTDAVRTYCETLGCATARINSTGIYDESSGKWRLSNATKGIEDIDVVMPVTINNTRVGLKIAVEVKIGRDTQSDVQKKRQERVELAGGHYIIAKTFDTFKQDFDRIKQLYAKTT